MSALTSRPACAPLRREHNRCFQSRGPAPRLVVAQAAKGKAVDAPVPQLNRPKPASANQQAQAQPPAPAVSAAALAQGYVKAAEAQARGDSIDVKVVGQNEGGVMVQFWGMRGFIPYNQVDPGRLKASANGDLTPLVGQQLKARIISADVTRKELVLSERRVTAVAALGRIKPGDELACTVTGIEDYGAFVQAQDMPEVFGLVHKSELSWDRLLTVDQAVTLGQQVRTKVLSVDPASCRLSLSIKQLSADPLSTSLDSLAWSELPGSPEQQAEAAQGPVAVLVEALRGSVGVGSVAVTRTAQDPHHVAQELAVYLTRSDTAGEYTAVARHGVSATELRLTAADLTREQMKQLLQRLATRAAQQ